MPTSLITDPYFQSRYLLHCGHCMNGCFLPVGLFLPVVGVLLQSSYSFGSNIPLRFMRGLRFWVSVVLQHLSEQSTPARGFLDEEGGTGRATFSYSCSWPLLLLLRKSRSRGQYEVCIPTQLTTGVLWEQWWNTYNPVFK